MKKLPKVCIKEKKYRLEESLNKLTHQEYRFAKSVLPSIIGKCHNTISNYVNILSGSVEEIPYSVGIKLEQFFGLEPGGISYTKENEKNLKDLYQEWRAERIAESVVLNQAAAAIQ